MSLNVIVSTFFCLTIPVAAMSLFKKAKDNSYLSLSDFKNPINIFHSFSDEPDTTYYDIYTEIRCDEGYSDIWGDDLGYNN